METLKSQILIILYLRDKFLKAPYKSCINLKTFDNEQNIQIAINELKAAGLVEGSEAEKLELTIQGGYEVQVKYFNPSQSTSINIVQISQMVNSALQQGSADGKISLSIDDANQLKQFINKVDNHIELDIINSALINNHANAENLIRKYYTQLLNEFKSFEIGGFEGEYMNGDWGKKIQESLIRMLPLRNKLLDLFYGIVDNSSKSTNEIVHPMLEQLLQFNFLPYEYFDQLNTVGYLRFDNFRIFIYEIFLHLSCHLIEQEKFNQLAFLLHTPYQIRLVDKSKNHDSYKSYNFTKFNFNPILLNNTKDRFAMGILDGKDPLVELLLSRKTPDQTEDSLKETDVFLFLVSIFNEQNLLTSGYWTPYLSKARVKSIEIMKKAVSCRYFERIKPLFNINAHEDFQKDAKRIIGVQFSQHGEFRQQYGIREYEFLLNSQFLCTQP